MQAIEDLFSSYREECLVPSVVFSENSRAVTLRVKEKEEHGGWKIWPSYFPAKVKKHTHTQTSNKINVAYF